ncbi:winged helix-turn-helix domain-containing protein [Enterobacter sp. CC120223-11]|uniref:winged helix-turn-helix domain-containing protein n=1 Tax=Enterobacter sp. CC120223-11 TaxID=1378073 RepID=UPI000BC6627C|nr:winged helix-turn-helix domain-containing protein [Enterobacter sp. CC120223-11]SNY69798.1 DNA-binding winged helix-turn-helix (wHTH) domain-containing protein [Enterobacter sp. CC120223-11]
MKYIIEDRIIFRPDDGTFWMTEREGEKVILPPIMARLMTLLLEEQGEVLTRDEIMDRVWTIHGLEPSGNSLNQYISNIRRNFQNVGLGDEVIKTIPRIGFVLSSEIKIEKDDRVVPVSETAPDIQQREPTQETGSRSVTRKSFCFPLFAVFIAAMTVTPFILKAGINQINDRSLITVPVDIGKINECDVKTLKMDNASHHPEVRSVAQRIFDTEDIRCANGEAAFLFIQSSVFYNQPGRIFVSVCRENHGELVSCKSHSFNNWL